MNELELFGELMYGPGGHYRSKIAQAINRTIDTKMNKRAKHTHEKELMVFEGCCLYMMNNPMEGPKRHYFGQTNLSGGDKNSLGDLSSDDEDEYFKDMPHLYSEDSDSNSDEDEEASTRRITRVRPSHNLQQFMSYHRCVAGTYMHDESIIAWWQPNTVVNMCEFRGKPEPVGLMTSMPNGGV